MNVFLGRENQYCENDYTTKCNLQIQCDLYQITKGIFHKTTTKYFTVHMETEKTLHSQSSLAKEEWSQRNQFDFRLNYKTTVIIIQCMLSSCSFNLYAECIMRNAGLDEAQVGSNIARRNISNLRYADDTTLMAESEEELKSS